jgi:ketosteroid isomerase-like protein
MKRKHFILVLFFSFLLITLITCKNTDNESNRTTKQALITDSLAGEYLTQLQEIGRILNEAVLNGDHETLLKYYTDDIVILANSVPAIKGKEAIRALYEKDREKGLKFHAFSGKPEKMWGSGNKVYEYGTYGAAVSNYETKHPYGFAGSYFTIWQKQKNGTFLMEFVMTNLDHKPYTD